ncbi:response regulator transcription factor [Alteribacillus bidgolensis]|uniref:Two-component system, OmpR family, response regulator ResD n=1 Tax=Alteribacillus bidgolensis TaxID=930129 RepID=A0A1G8S6C7_9BACI|nr:response regulator transcription factor [Alteribacillus bidgolensis]SDJ24733.1 two-component system, OmpR family, response regulator ResD [Alteribacillus bidgolensis]
MGQYSILVVDDEWNMRNLLRVYLGQEDFQITEAANGEEAFAKLASQAFDLVILDLMMPGVDGWEVCARIRQTSQVPILMLTARTETKDKVQGLNLGADDYLTKPFEPEELVARVNALLRRVSIDYSEHTSSDILTFQDITIDPEKREVFVHDQVVDLTPKEFDLLYVLAKRPGRVFAREVLLNQVWGDDYFGDLRTVDTHVKKIREKVRKAGAASNPIETVWGVGYKAKEKESGK